MDNYLLPYLLIMLHLISGAFFLILINRKLDSSQAREQWTKFISYVILFNLLWNAKLFSDTLFITLAALITVLCSFEWWKAIKMIRGTVGFAIGYILILMGFWKFLYLADSLILLTIFVVILFDGSSQISGQLLGKNPLLPRISPSKTLEGLIGGILITMGTVFVVRSSFEGGWIELLGLSLGIMFFAFVGDLMASYVKRKAGLIIFSRILPGHGGFLDRYDSLLMAGCAVFLFSLAKEVLG
jgi:phosphatidate cytidylyltransferase